MKCHDLEAYLTDYLEGDLDQARTDEMLDHIEGCEACRAEFQTYERQEERLGRFFKQQLAAVADAKNPLAEAAPSGERSPSAARPIRWLAWAAAAVLCLTAGIGGWSVYRRVVPAGQALLAEVKAVEGRVLALEGNAYQTVAPGAPVRQGQRLKVAGGGYLALELPDGNIIEARGGTQLTLLDFPDRLETAMDRGNVWAHLKTPPPKPFVIRTAHLTATAVGTVYNVEEGLDRSEVTVAEGEVLVESGGTQTSVSESETYSTLTGATQTADAAAALWSRYKEDILALLPGGDATAPTETPQLVVQVAAAAAPLHAAVEYLPENTLYFLDVRDWRGIVEEFRATDYSALLQEESIRQWWEAVGARKILDEIRAETRILDVLGVVGMIEGELAVGVNAEGDVLGIADCGANDLEIAARIESLLAGSAQTPDGAISGEDISAKIAEHVLVAGDLLILSSDPILTQATFDRVVNAQPTGFTESAFYQKILRDVDDPRFIMAANLGGQIARIVDGLADESGAADIGHALDLLGLPSLDYLLLSPSFAGQGMNQAARLAFVEDGRFGAMDWLAEPAPMRGLDFLSPDIPFFASAIVRNPHQLCLDYLLYMQDTQPEQDFQRALRFVAQNEAFFNAFGGEVA
ncbi:MAG TPA: FecR domain-containing protein, partial [Sumerlaeia bacterium]|nr:FecR domain-containing protein [Sumerlaeia bacterium]